LKKPNKINKLPAQAKIVADFETIIASASVERLLTKKSRDHHSPPSNKGWAVLLFVIPA
jgi:hypothetical protein